MMPIEKEPRWTDALVRKLSGPAGKADSISWDPELPSFGVRLRAGKATYVAQYRIGRQQRRESLGDVRKLNLADARQAARLLFAKAVLDIDPVAERARLAAEQAAARDTFLEAARDYLAARKPKMRPNTYVAADRYLTKHCTALHKKGVSAVSFEDVAGLIRDLVKRHGETSAARARSTLAAFYVWAMQQGRAKSNPVIGTANPLEGREPRDRVLNDDEIRLIWRQAGDDDFGKIIRLLFLTGCRRDEIGGLRWSEIDLAAGRMTLPKERVKNKRVHVLLLPATACEILSGVRRRNSRDTLFGGGASGFNAWSYNTLRMNAAITATTGKALAPWRLHDIRRTVRTRLSKLGVLPHIAELVLNHAGHKSGIGAVYDHHDFQTEIGAALKTWEANLLAIVRNG
jgi:integrase